MNRRDFVFRTLAGLVVFAGGGLLLSACGSEDTTGEDSPEADGDCSNDAATVYTNPGHAHTELGLSAADAGAAGNYVVLGGSHTHEITLSAADVTTLAGGGTVSVGDNDGHGHIIEISC